MDYENQGVFKTLLVFAMDEGFDHLDAAFGGLWHGLIMPFFSKSVTYVVVLHAFFCVMILGVGGGVGVVLGVLVRVSYACLWWGEGGGRCAGGIV